MQTTWKWSPDSEINRILFTCKGIANGFYHLNNFLPLPDSHDLNSSRAESVILPQLRYQKIPKFWNSLKENPTHIEPTTKNLKHSAQLKKNLIKLNLSDPTNSTIVKKWQKYENKILEAIYELIPSKNNQIKSLTIYPTHFGTTCSFNAPTNWPADLFVWLRHDQGIRAITEAILTSLTRFEVSQDYDGSWRESEVIVDWLIDHSHLNKLLQKIEPVTTFQSTLKSTKKKKDCQLKTISERFLHSIGAPNLSKPFTVKNEIISFNNEPLLNLSKREHAILKLLIDQNPQTATYDEIANIIFNTEENYSLYTISKSVERLRKRLEKNGVSPEYIQTYRSKGYYLTQ